MDPPPAKVKKHKDEQSLAQWVDMEVSREKRFKL
jgi:hypothetical protein